MPKTNQKFQMKNRILSISFALIAIAGLTTLTGCKKGENDPVLSLKSRKARISGEWKLNSGTITETFSGSGGSGTALTTYTGSSKTVNGSTVTYTETLTIEKDGTFEVEIIEDGDISTVSGNWFFSGKNKDGDLKNKEAVIFSELKYTSSSGTDTYSGLYGDQILMIDQLKNKELIFKGSSTYQQTGGDSGSYAYDRTFEKQ